MFAKMESKYSIFIFVKYFILGFLLSILSSFIILHLLKIKYNDTIKVINLSDSIFFVSIIILPFIIIPLLINAFNIYKMKKLAVEKSNLLLTLKNKETELNEKKNYIEEEKNVYIDIQKKKLHNLQTKYEVEYYNLKHNAEKLKFENQKLKNKLMVKENCKPFEINYNDFNNTILNIQNNITLLSNIINYNTDINIIKNNNEFDYEKLLLSTIESGNKNITIFYPDKSKDNLVKYLIGNKENSYNIIWTNYYEEEIISLLNYLNNNNLTEVKVEYINQKDLDFVIIDNELLLSDVFKKDHYKIYYYNKTGISKIANDLCSNNNSYLFEINTDILNETIKKENMLILKFSTRDYILESDKINVFLNYLEENKNNYIHFISFYNNNDYYFLSLLQNDLLTIPF